MGFPLTPSFLMIVIQQGQSEYRKSGYSETTIEAFKDESAMRMELIMEQEGPYNIPIV